jgi:hypothetical protein
MEGVAFEEEEEEEVEEERGGEETRRDNYHIFLDYLIIDYPIGYRGVMVVMVVVVGGGGGGRVGYNTRVDSQLTIVRLPT